MIKKPCRDCQRRGLTLFWGRCTRCHNARREEEERRQRERPAPVKPVACQACRAMKKELEEAQKNLFRAQKELREWSTWFKDSVPKYDERSFI